MPLWLMNADELEAAHRIAVAYEEATCGSDRARAAEVFGDEDASRYERLQRRAHSTSRSFADTDAASAEIEQMEGSLSEAQRRRLFGIGEVDVITPELVREYMSALAALDLESPQALGVSLACPLLRLGTDTNPAEMGHQKQIAFAQVRAALEHADGQGWDRGRVLSAAAKAVGRRYADAEDARYMTAHIVAALPPERAAAFRPQAR